MSDLLKPRSASAAHKPQVVDESDMARLRRLLLGKDYEQLTAMRAEVERLLAAFIFSHGEHRDPHD